MEKEKANDLYKRFIYIAFLFGILFVMLTPPMAAPDENSHYINAYALSTGNIFPEYEGNDLGRDLPSGVVEFVNQYNNKYAGKLDSKYDFKEMYESWALASDFSDVSFYSYWNADVNLLAYIPSAFGMFLLRVMAKLLPFVCVSNYNLLETGRLFNLGFSNFPHHYRREIQKLNF